MKKTTKAVVYSKNRTYAYVFMEQLNKDGFKATIDNYLGNYVIYVNENEYDEALEYGRENGNAKLLGSVNDYGEFRDLLATSLVYIDFRDHKKTNEVYDSSKSEYLTNLLHDIESIVGSVPYFSVNHSDGCIEILINTENLEGSEEWRKKIVLLVENNYSTYFKKCVPCKGSGKVLFEEKVKEKLDFEGLLNSSMIFDGIRNPIGSNIAPHPDYENNLEENGLWIGTHSFGGQDFKITSLESGKFDGSIELFEMMKFNSLWDAEWKTSIPVRTESTLIDNVTFSSIVNVLSDDECEIITDFSLNRKTSILNNVVSENRYPTTKSVRNGLFPFPLEDGMYNGNYKERFVKIAGGTRVLHYSDISPFFEVFDIPENFDFKTNSFEEYPKVFDDNSFDKNDKDLNEIMKYVNENTKKLILENKDN